MRPFRYVQAKSLDHACSLLHKHGDRARILAGGQNVLLMLKERVIDPAYVIDIKGLPGLDHLVDRGNEIAIGALVTHRALETATLVRERLPILADAEKVLALVQIRNWGTVAGELCEADPGSDLAAPLLALGARLKTISSNGPREIPIERFFTGYMETSLGPDEIVTEIAVPALPAHTQGAYVKESVRVGDYSIAGAAVVVTLDGDVIRDARIVLGSVGPTPLRARAAEGKLVGGRADGPLDEAGAAAAAESRPVADTEGSVEYKRQLVRVVTKQALTVAIRRARES